jgi:hypothetical protein
MWNNQSSSHMLAQEVSFKLLSLIPHYGVLFISLISIFLVKVIKKSAFIFLYTVISKSTFFFQIKYD